MKRAYVFVTLLLAVLFIASIGATTASADPGWWVWTDWVEDGDFTNIQDDFDDFKAEYDASVVPSGGTAGQILTKSSDSDWDMEWGDVYDWEPRVGTLESGFANHEHRLGNLEETQWIIGLGARISDTKSGTLSAFADYSVNRSKFDRVGIRYELKLGKSYEEKLIEEKDQEIAELRSEIEAIKRAVGLQ